MHEYLSAVMGQNSLAVISKEEEFTTFGMRANNDPSKGTFATFTDILCNAGHINLGSAVGIGQSWYNRDFACRHNSFDTTGKANQLGTSRNGHISFAIRRVVGFLTVTGCLQKKVPNMQEKTLNWQSTTRDRPELTK